MTATRNARNRSTGKNKNC